MVQALPCVPFKDFLWMRWSVGVGLVRSILRALASQLPLLGSGLFLALNVVTVGDKDRFFSVRSLCFFLLCSVLWSTSDLSLFQYNDAQFSCAFEKKEVNPIPVWRHGILVATREERRERLQLHANKKLWSKPKFLRPQKY
jgi:hypothetical protein